MEEVLFGSSRTVDPIACAARASVGSNACRQFGPLPFAPPVSNPSVEVALGSHVAFANVYRSSRVVVFLRLTVKDFHVDWEGGVVGSF